MIDLTECIGKFRIVCTACDFYTEYVFDDEAQAAGVAEAHRTENPEHPQDAILVVTPANKGSLCHGHMRRRIRRP